MPATRSKSSEEPRPHGGGARWRDDGAIVPRGRLVERLIAGNGTPVVLIDAPAGFGKSTVLEEWADADPRPFARLTLGERHDDPVLLTASIAGAVAELSPIDEQVYAALYGAQQGTMKVAIPRLLESMHDSDDAIVLALDDAHLLSSPESLEVVASLAAGLPGGSQLALASRTEPSIGVSRLRANRELTELTAPDLAMTDGEADLLLRSCGLELQPESVELLVEHTEGWPAALYLATLSLRDAEDADQAAREFAGDDRIVADYLRDEFVARLSSEQLDFLTRTAIIDELHGDLCDSVLGAGGSAEMLHELARGNALVNAVDAKERTFRYHALLREMLGSELHRSYPRDESALHARASKWFGQRGDFDRAVPHAIATGELDLAADLIWSQAAAYASVGREATLRLWLKSFSEPEIDGSAPLCLVRATCGLSAGDGAQVAHWTGRALAAVATQPRPDGDALRIAAGAIQAAGSARDGVARMRDDAVRAFELMPEETPWRGLCKLIEGCALHLSGDPEAARAALEGGARSSAVGEPSVHSLCLSQLALVALDADDLDEASRLTSAALARIEINALADQPTTALILAVAALVEARLGEAAGAAAHIRHASHLLDGLNEMSPWYECEVRVVIARTLVLLDDVAAARAQLADAGRRLHQTGEAPVLRSWLEQAWSEADAATISGRWPLSPAELRLLRYLPTHLTFREIADESFVSANTVKTQARSIYRKLGVSSRAEAVATARTAGLLEG